MGFMFEKLEVYQKAVDFAERIFKLTDELPRGQAALEDQFKRASRKVMADGIQKNGKTSF